MELLASYEEAKALTRQMQAAAQRLDWDTLTALEARRAPLLLNVPDTLPPTVAPALQQLIHDILAADADIRERLESWHEATGALLKGLTPRP